MSSKKKRNKDASSPVGRDSETGRFIEAALNNSKYKARTIDGIARETKLTVGTVVATIKHDRRLRATVKLLPRKSEDGRVLITTKKRFSAEASIKDKFIDIFSTKIPDLDDEK